MKLVYDKIIKGKGCKEKKGNIDAEERTASARGTDSSAP